MIPIQDVQARNFGPWTNYPGRMDSVVGTASRLQAGRQTGRGSISERGKKRFSALQTVQSSCGAHPASYSISTWGAVGKAVEAWSWPLRLHCRQGSAWVEPYLHPDIYVYLMYSDNFALISLSSWLECFGFPHLSRAVSHDCSSVTTFHTSVPSFDMIRNFFKWT